MLDSRAADTPLYQARNDGGLISEIKIFNKWVMLRFVFREFGNDLNLNRSPPMKEVAGALIQVSISLLQLFPKQA